jgi:hypothetical protein
MLAGAMPARALVIIPTWDSSITNDPNAAAIQGTINTAIQYYQTRLSDPITVRITFEEMAIAGLEGHSQWWYYNISYPQWRGALQRDATTTNDNTALANLPAGDVNPATGANTIRVKTANLRALGITGMNSGLAGGVDGIIGLHTSQMNLSRASIEPDKYDLLAVTEHEIDEVLGLGSGLDTSPDNSFPEDLLRFTSSGARTFTTNGDDAYFSIDGASLLARFNQNVAHDHGDWWCSGPHAPQVQDAVETAGATPNPGIEMIALDVIGYNLEPVPRPVITGINLSGSILTINGASGLASGTYSVLSSTDLALPLNQWTPVATKTLGASGNFNITITNAVNGDDAARFFTLQLQ